MADETRQIAQGQTAIGQMCYFTDVDPVAANKCQAADDFIVWESTYDFLFDFFAILN